MRCLLFFIYVFVFNLNAQNSNNGGLSTSELQTAKEKYLHMMKTETYILKKKSHRDISKKIKDAGVPPIETFLVGSQLSEEQTWKKMTLNVRKWLTENFNKTKFTSVDEGVKTIMTSIELQRKIEGENKDLFDLLKRANKEQMHEILKLESDF